MKVPILRLRGEDGKMHDVPAIRGEDGHTPVKGVDYWTEEDKQQLLGELSVSAAPSYIVSEAARAAEQVQAVRTAKTLVFPVLTDFHLYAGNSDHDASLASARYAGLGIRELQKRIPMDFVGLLGDYSWMSSAEYTAEQVKADIAAVKQALALGSEKQVWCVGNHDLNYSEGRDRMLTPDELYAYIGANSGGVKPYADMERCYGYLDLDSQKIRVIYLNTCDYQDWTVIDGESMEAAASWISPTQIQWLADTALNFSDKGDEGNWGVVIIGHHPLSYPLACFANALKILEAYRDGTSGTLSCPITNTGSELVTYDFSTQTERAEIICNIHGHAHNCGSSKISSTSWYYGTNYDPNGVAPWLWRFCIPNICSGRNNEAAVSTNERLKHLLAELDESGDPVYWVKEAGTADATSFCIVSIDRANKRIYAHIFGAGKDREFSYAPEALQGYTNQLPISTDTDGSIYNGTGFKADTYLSGGNPGNKTGIAATGFIPIPSISSADLGQAVLHFANTGLDTTTNTRFAFYGSSKTHVFTKYGNQTVTQDDPELGAQIIASLDGNNKLVALDVTEFVYNYNSTTPISFIRLCGPGIDENSIITVNEEITG